MSGADDIRDPATLPFRPAYLVAAEDARAKRRVDQVEAAVENLRIQREARRRLDAEEHAADTPPEILSLRELLAQPDPVVRWRIEGLQPVDSRVVLAAPNKAGKTTLVGGLVRSLTDGDPFLGRFAVEPIDGPVATVDLEMSRGQVRTWLREQRIANDDRVLVISLRGRAASLNLMDPLVRASYAAWFRERRVRYLILDPLRPVLDALGLDENRDAGRFLVALDALLQEAGIPEALIVHHMGHTAERSRGDSRLRDYPDVEWRIVRQSEDPASPRYITAYGRDVALPESLLTFEPATRRLTIANGSRRDAVTRAALDDILAALTNAAEPLSVRAIEAACAGNGIARSSIRAAIAAGIRRQSIVAEPGPKRSMLHRLPGQCASAPECAESAPAQSNQVSAPVRRHPIRVAHSHTRQKRSASRSRKGTRAKRS